MRASSAHTEKRSLLRSAVTVRNIESSIPPLYLLHFQRPRLYSSCSFRCVCSERRGFSSVREGRVVVRSIALKIPPAWPAIDWTWRGMEYISISTSCLPGHSAFRTATSTTLGMRTLRLGIFRTGVYAFLFYLCGIWMPNFSSAWAFWTVH